MELPVPQHSTAAGRPGRDGAQLADEHCRLAGSLGSAAVRRFDSSSGVLTYTIPFTIRCSTTGNLQEFSIVDDVVEITDKELKKCGVRGSHRQKMANSLLGVRAKRRQSMNLEGKFDSMISLVSPSESGNLFNYH